MARRIEHQGIIRLCRHFPRRCNAIDIGQRLQPRRRREFIAPHLRNLEAAGLKQILSWQIHQA